MSRVVSPAVVVEWSPTHVSWVGPNHQLITVDSFAEAAAQLPGRDIVVAISRRTAFVRAYRVPNTSKSEVQRILSMQIGQLFPIPVNEVSFDVHLTHDVNSEGRLAIIAAMRSSDLIALHQSAKSAGLRVTRVSLVALGSPAIAVSNGQPSAAVVHRTAEGLAVELVVDGELRYSRVAAMPTTSIGIDGEISRTFAAAVLSCSPTIAAGGLALPDADVSTDSWALEGVASSATDIDIRTPDQMADQTRRGEQSRLRLSLLVFGAGVILFAWQFLKWKDAQALFDQGQAKWQKKRASQKRLRDDLIAKGASLGTLRSALDRAFHAPQSFSDVFMLASNDTPAGVWVTGVSLERGKALVIRGTATKSEAITNYQTALVHESRLRDVKLLFATNTQIDNNPVVQFSISAFPKGNVPLAEPTKKKAGGSQ